jgi:amino acid transporter
MRSAPLDANQGVEGLSQSVIAHARSGEAEKNIGAIGALSLGVGGIVGGGFFATFGLAIIGARGSTFLSFLVGGFIALLTAYSYVGLTLRYPDPAGTVGFVRRAYGHALLPASVNVLLILSYVCVMAVYAHAFGAYAASYFPIAEQPFLLHLLASAAIFLLGAINYVGAALMARFEGAFNLGKLGALVAFIIAGFLLGAPDWSRLGVDNWAPAPRIVSSGIIAFLSYEGFELISNAAPRIRNPARTMPIAFYGSVIIAILLYVLAIVVAIGHMPFDAMAAARNFALSATAERFMGSFGFALMTVGAMFASASAINADFFGASKLPAMIAEYGEAPAVFDRASSGRPVVSMLFVGAGALFAVNCVELAALSAATSAGFLVVFAVVNLAHVRLSHETGGRRGIARLGAAACVAALGVTFYDFVTVPELRLSAASMLGIVVLSIVSAYAYSAFGRSAARAGARQVVVLLATAGAAVAAIMLAAWPVAPANGIIPPSSPATVDQAAPAPQMMTGNTSPEIASPPAVAPVAQDPAPAPREARKKRKRRRA